MHANTFCFKVHGFLFAKDICEKHKNAKKQTRKKSYRQCSEIRLLDPVSGIKRVWKRIN